MNSMKHHVSSSKGPEDSHSKEWEEKDPLWDLLDQASTQEPDTFFARNVVRSVRQLDTGHTTTVSSLSARILALFTSRKLALTAVACTCALVTFQLWPKNTSSATAQINQPAQSPQQPQEAVAVTVVTLPPAFQNW